MDRQELSDAVWERIAPHFPGKATDPGRTTTAQWRSFDPTLYKDRNLIERFFNKIKHFRRIATRYDKLARNYAGFLNLVAALKCCL